MMRRIALIALAAATLGVAAPVAAQAHYDGDGGWYGYHRTPYYAYDDDEPGWWRYHHRPFFFHHHVRRWWNGPGYGYGYRSW